MKLTTLNMTLGKLGSDFIKALEELRLKVYRDIKGVPTIGWGHTGLLITMLMRSITVEQAQKYFDSDTSSVVKCINTNVKVPLTQNQFDALVCLVFNIGVSAFKASTLLRLLNQGNYIQAGKQFLVWHKVRIKGVYVASQGLANRRAKELTIFNTK